LLTFGSPQQDGGGGVLRLKLGVGEQGLGAPPATGRASTGAVFSCGSPGAIGLARQAMF
jgi:hypothetical protein